MSFCLNKAIWIILSETNRDDCLEMGSNSKYEAEYLKKYENIEGGN